MSRVFGTATTEDINVDDITCNNITCRDRAKFDGEVDICGAELAGETLIDATLEGDTTLAIGHHFNGNLECNNAIVGQGDATIVGTLFASDVTLQPGAVLSTKSSFPANPYGYIQSKTGGAFDLYMGEGNDNPTDDQFGYVLNANVGGGNDFGLAFLAKNGGAGTDTFETVAGLYSSVNTNSAFRGRGLDVLGTTQTQNLIVNGLTTINDNSVVMIAPANNYVDVSTGADGPLIPNEIRGAQDLNSDFGYLRMSAGGAPAGGPSRSYIDLLGYNVADPLESIRLGTQAQERMRITNNGIGIGTTTPGALLDVNGTTQTQDLQATGNAIIDGDLSVNGLIKGNVEFTGETFTNTTLSGTTTATGNVNISGDLRVEGETTALGLATLLGGATVVGPFITGDAFIENKLNVDGAADIDGSLNITDKLNVVGNANISGELITDSSATIYGPLSVVGDFPGEFDDPAAPGDLQAINIRSLNAIYGGNPGTEQLMYDGSVNTLDIGLRDTGPMYVATFNAELEQVSTYTINVNIDFNVFAERNEITIAVRQGPGSTCALTIQSNDQAFWSLSGFNRTTLGLSTTLNSNYTIVKVYCLGPNNAFAKVLLTENY